MCRDVYEVTRLQLRPFWPAPHRPVVAGYEVEAPRLELSCFARRGKVEKPDHVKAGPFDGLCHGAIDNLCDAKLAQSHQTTKAVPTAR